MDRGGIARQDFKVCMSPLEIDGPFDMDWSATSGPGSGAAEPGPVPLGSPMLPAGHEPVPSPMLGLLVGGAAP
jgi:hypothetical protein